MSPWLPRAASLACIVLAACASDAPPTPAPPPSPEPAPIAAPAPAAQAAPAPAPPGHAAAAQEPDEDEVTGKSLYLRHCAGCHNANGDGKGATMLQQGKQARSFAQGGFAFGNTVEQIAKTIASGIPGSSPMQGFKSVMDEDERKLVAEYVLTLTPYKAEAKAKDSVMVVGDRAVFAYGKLPALHEGLPERPRGLLIGLPGGISFEYRIDDVRLLAVRKGAFADRTDWNERGGGVLQPLGEIVEAFQEGDPGPWVFVGGSSERTPVELDLDRASIEAGGTNSVRLILKPRHAEVGSVRMSVQVSPIRRGNIDGYSVSVSEATFRRDLQTVIVSWPPDTKFVRGGPPRSSETTDGVLLPIDTKDGWIVIERQGEFDLVGITPSSLLHWQRSAGRWCIVQTVPEERGSRTVPVMERLTSKVWSEDLLAKWYLGPPGPGK